jgi:hypothetical protein
MLPTPLKWQETAFAVDLGYEGGDGASALECYQSKVLPEVRFDADARPAPSPHPDVMLERGLPSISHAE